LTILPKSATMGESASRKYGCVQDLLLIVVSVSSVLVEPCFSLLVQVPLTDQSAELFDVLHCEKYCCEFAARVRS
jgi:hypothetical protein